MAPILGKPVSRRSLLRTAGAITGAVGTLALLQDGAIVPQRLALADPATPFPDVQFDLGPFMPPAVTYDGIPVGMPPVHTVFLTATLSRAPSRADQSRMESALRTIESNYPYAPGGVFTHVSYSDNYFARLPGSVVDATMPRTLSGNQPVLKRAVASPTDVAPGAHVLELRRPEFNVPLRLENNDVLFTVRGDDPSYVADVVNWLSGSNKLVGRSIASPRFDAGMRITSSRAMFVQIGLPRYVAANAGFKYQSFVNSDSSMWMGFADQQVNASAPAHDVTFVGGDGIHLTTPRPGATSTSARAAPVARHPGHGPVLLDLNAAGVARADGDVPGACAVHVPLADPPPAEAGRPVHQQRRPGLPPNMFQGAGDAAGARRARHAAENSAHQHRMGHLSCCSGPSRTADGRPIHLRIDGPGLRQPWTFPTGPSSRSCSSSGLRPDGRLLPPRCGSTSRRWTCWRSSTCTRGQRAGAVHHRDPAAELPDPAAPSPGVPLAEFL